MINNTMLNKMAKFKLLLPVI